MQAGGRKGILDKRKINSFFCAPIENSKRLLLDEFMKAKAPVIRDGL
jgi:hypothetical protein